MCFVAFHVGNTSSGNLGANLRTPAYHQLEQVLPDTLLLVDQNSTSVHLNLVCEKNVGIV